MNKKALGLAAALFAAPAAWAVAPKVVPKTQFVLFRAVREVRANTALAALPAVKALPVASQALFFSWAESVRKKGPIFGWIDDSRVELVSAHAATAIEVNVEREVTIAALSRRSTIVAKLAAAVDEATRGKTEALSRLFQDEKDAILHMTEIAEIHRRQPYRILESNLSTAH